PEGREHDTRRRGFLMKVIAVALGAGVGAVLGAVGTFVVLNLVGFLWYMAFHPSDEGLDTGLFYLSVIASPAAGAVGGVLGALIGWRRASRAREGAAPMAKGVPEPPGGRLPNQP